MNSSATKPCPFCAEEINANAIKCKHCGSMLVDKPVVIEQTSKKYKRQMVISGYCAAVGFFMTIVGTGSDIPFLIQIGSLMTIGGIIGVIVARMSAWWHHG